MRKRTFFILIFVFLAIPVHAASHNFSSKKETHDSIIVEKPLSELPLGEKLYFEVSWMGVNVGFGQIEVKEKTTVNGREAYHLVATAQTNQVLSALYPVYDQAQSWVDAKTFYSLKFRKTLSEGHYRADEEVEFHPEEKKGLYHSYKDGSRKEFRIDGPVHDIVSAFYWFRLQEASPGQSVKTVVNSEEKTWDLEVKTLGLANKVIHELGTIGTLYVEPKTSLKGALYSRGRVWVYFTADKRRMPVWVLFKTPFGPVNGVLSVRKSSV